MSHLNLANEPQCWICELTCYWDGDDSGPTIGTGFLVNYRDSEKHCIMTAGHNIISQEKNRVNRVEIKFPGGNIGLHATGDQCFVSQSYEAFPNEDNDVNDYGLIAVDRKENEGKLGGFAFSTLIPRSNLNTSQVFVYGYPQGGALQGNSSRLADVKPNQLFHDVATSPGVSGAPVWIKHRDGYSTAIGIHNYGGSTKNKNPKKRATRLTIDVVREMASWIGDCRLNQSIESGKLSGTFLKASTGLSTTALSRNGRDRYTGFDFILVEAPPYKPKDSQGYELQHQYLISPAALNPPVFLKYDASSNTQQATFVKAGDLQTVKNDDTGTICFALSKKDQLITAEDPNSKEKSTGIFNLSPVGYQVLLRLRTTNITPRYECECVLESDEVTFVKSTEDSSIKTGSKIFISSNSSANTPGHDAAVGVGVQAPSGKPEATDEFGRTPIYRAANAGDTDTVKDLLEKSGDLDAQCVCGMTALSKAAVNGHLDVVKLLLQHRASQSIENNYRDTALLLATRNGHDDVKQQLIDFTLPSEKDLEYASFNLFQNFIEEKNLGELVDRESLKGLANKVAAATLSLVKAGWEEEFALELGLLALYDIAILVDDSMTIENREQGIRKRQVEQGLKTIARIFSVITNRKIRTVIFTNRGKEHCDIREEDISGLLKAHRFADVTQIDKALNDRILVPYVNESYLSKPLLVVTITDCKTKGNIADLKRGINSAIGQLPWSEAVAFQFARVGNEAGTEKYLAQLDLCAGVGKSVNCPSGGWGFDEITKDGKDIERRRTVKNLLIGAIRDAYYNQGAKAEQLNIKERDEKSNERERQERERQEKANEARMREAEEELVKKKEELIDKDQDFAEKQHENWKKESLRVHREKSYADMQRAQIEAWRLSEDWKNLRLAGWPWPRSEEQAQSIFEFAVENGLSAAARHLWNGWGLEFIEFKCEFDVSVAFVHAARKGWEEMVQFLLVDCGAKLEARNRHNRTALHEAASNGYERVVQFLINEGANRAAKDKDGRTPLDLAKKKKHNKVVRLL